jgi:hypothetical protein
MSIRARGTHVELVAKESAQRRHADPESGRDARMADAA